MGKCLGRDKHYTVYALAIIVIDYLNHLQKF